MMHIKSPLGGLSDGGLTFDQATEIHRLLHEDCLTPSAIARVAGISLAMVSGVLAGRYFPGAAKRWERRS